MAAQTDTTKTVKSDTVVPGKEKKQKDRRRKDEFIVYAGPNFNQLKVSSDIYKSSTKIGYQIGAAYKRGKFFYWQAGGRFNSAVYGLEKISHPADSTDNVTVNNIDLEVTGGINFLSFMNRVLALRLFVSAVPSFTLGVGSNNVGLTKSDFNSFIFYGQGGIGVDVAFFILEAGYNYGFQDLLKNGVKSTPGQLFVNLGFRF